MPQLRMHMLWSTGQGMYDSFVQLFEKRKVCYGVVRGTKVKKCISIKVFIIYGVIDNVVCYCKACTNTL